MKPAIVMPMSDPNGWVFPHLIQALPDLKLLFETGIVSIPNETQQSQPLACQKLKSDVFFRILPLPSRIPIGEQFLALYEFATQVCHPDQFVHLCYPDRVSYALQSHYRQEFIKDIQQINSEVTPLLFQRSTRAWQTHPAPYRKLEQMVTDLGEILFNISLDFAWCHLVIQTRDLKHVLTKITHRDIAMVAEIILNLRGKIHTSEVDWLAWEDPFILNKEAIKLREERATNPIELQKRLSYVLPMMQILGDAYNHQ